MRKRPRGKKAKAGKVASNTKEAQPSWPQGFAGYRLGTAAPHLSTRHGYTCGAVSASPSSNGLAMLRLPRRPVGAPRTPRSREGPSPLPGTKRLSAWLRGGGGSLLASSGGRTYLPPQEPSPRTTHAP